MQLLGKNRQFARLRPSQLTIDAHQITQIKLLGKRPVGVADLILAQSIGYIGLVIGVLLWGAHMALTQGIFARMIADSAPEELRATSFGAFWFVTGIASLFASLGAGWLWDRQGSSATFLTSAAVAAAALAMLSLLGEERRA